MLLLVARKMLSANCEISSSFGHYNETLESRPICTLSWLLPTHGLVNAMRRFNNSWKWQRSRFCRGRQFLFFVCGFESIDHLHF